jgi:hypothetical protein
MILEAKGQPDCFFKFQFSFNSVSTPYASQVPERCRQFCRRFRTQLSSHSALRSCLSTHLANFWDFGLVDSDLVSDCLFIVDDPSAPQEDAAESDAAWKCAAIDSPRIRV